MRDLTADKLREVLRFDAETGDWRWRVSPSRSQPVGSKAGGVSRRGYHQIRVDGRLLQAHRLAWLYVYGAWPHGQIDHINGNRADNRIENLRDVSGAINQQNRRLPGKDNKTGALGVYERNGKFVSTIRVAGKTRYVGTYGTVADAHAAYVHAKRAIHAGCTI